ncbi:hypothetical protein HispidOSU_007031, partial [Sigmodon hispidus]
MAGWKYSCPLTGEENEMRHTWDCQMSLNTILERELGLEPQASHPIKLCKSRAEGKIKLRKDSGL